VPKVYSPPPVPSGSELLATGGLSRSESLLSLVVFALWLGIFGGGILVDTEPYRRAISAGGVAALEAIGSGGASSAAPVAASGAAGQGSVTSALVGAAAGAQAAPGLLESWVAVLLWFLPLNLALLCAISGVLGAFGSRANLHDDEARRAARDETSPYISALLRGFFVYLITISGLLLLDDAPLSAPTPGQYIRLAGLLSLFSFVVNYNPAIFSRLLVLAAERMRAADEPPQREVEIELALTRYRSGPEVAAAGTDTPEHRLSQLIDDLGPDHGGGNGGRSARTPGE
jgi:hypothetical protein